MDPSHPAYAIDWIWSNSSNVHVANNRAWFDTFTEFDSFTTSNTSDQSLMVEGIGDVKLTLRIDPNTKETTEFMLCNVLFAPKSICNIFAHKAAKGYMIEGLLTDLKVKHVETKEVVGVLQKGGTGLYSLLLAGKEQGESSLDPRGCYAISALWPEEEKAKWEAREKTVGEGAEDSGTG